MTCAENNALKQFILVCKTSKDVARLELKQAIETPGVYLFGEPLDMPSILKNQKMDHVAEYLNTRNRKNI